MGAGKVSLEKDSLKVKSMKPESHNCHGSISSRRNTQDGLLSVTTSQRHMSAVVRPPAEIYKATALLPVTHNGYVQWLTQPLCSTPAALICPCEDRIEAAGVPAVTLFILQEQRMRRSTRSWRCNTSRAWKESSQVGTGDTVDWVSARWGIRDEIIPTLQQVM